MITDADDMLLCVPASRLQLQKCIYESQGL